MPTMMWKEVALLGRLLGRVLDSLYALVAYCRRTIGIIIIITMEGRRIPLVEPGQLKICSIYDGAQMRAWNKQVSDDSDDGPKIASLVGTSTNSSENDWENNRNMLHKSILVGVIQILLVLLVVLFGPCSHKIGFPRDPGRLVGSNFWKLRVSSCSDFLSLLS
jgi:hypothetical protein